MHEITFYPLGNADTTLIKTEKGKTILFDYARVNTGEDKDKKECDLSVELNKELENEVDVFCVTHLDNDHVVGANDYFYFEHAKKYQSDERKKIKELWVPAEAIIESKDTCNESARVIQAEARHRLKNKKGIRVFSRPKKFKEWCDKNEGYDFEAIKHLIVDAGKLVPTLTLENDGVEFFVHCPFYSESNDIDRNNRGIVVQAKFDNLHNSTAILGADIDYEVWENIIKQTKDKKNEERLEWDLFHISHHCSYKALSSEKGKSKTEPSETIKWLYETQSRSRANLISPSKCIPTVFGPAEGEQPPHKQAFNYYNSISDTTVKVTMDHPTKKSPKPMKFKIDSKGVILITSLSSVSTGSRPSTRPARAGAK